MALVAAGLSRGERDLDAIDEYLAFHYIPPPLTGVTDVEALPPGTFIRRSADGAEQEGTWSQPRFGEGGAVTALDLDDILGAAVARQLRADVPVGVFLSGGLDSSLLLSYAAAAGAKPHAFTLTFSGHGDYDESQTASRLAEHYAVPHDLVALDFDFSNAVDAVSRAYDVPIADPSAIATLKLAEHARQHVTVALTGTGGDDLFAGYYRHRAHLLHRYIKRLPLGRIARLDPGRGRERRSRRALARSYLVRLAAGAAQNGWEQYLSVVGASTSVQALGAMRRQPLEMSAVRQRVLRRHDPGSPVATLDAIQEFELATYLDGNLMVKEDRATMAVVWKDACRYLMTVSTGSRRPRPFGSAQRSRGARSCCVTSLGTGFLEAGLANGNAALLFRWPIFSAVRGGMTRSGGWVNISRSSSTPPSCGDLVPQPDRAYDVWALTVLCAWDERLRAARRAGRAHAVAS